MYLDVSKALNDVGYDEKFQISATIDEVSYQGNIASCKWDDQILVRALNTGKGEAILEVSGGFSYNLPCDRCLKPVKNHMELRFSHQVLLESNEKVIEKLDDEDVEYTIGKEVDLREIVLKEILLNWPDKVLCKDDCKGLCSVCGQDLNLGDCGCDTFVPDPRWAKLKEFM